MRDRAFDELRKTRITLDYTKYAEGSVLIETGGTKVICTASFEEKVPFHKKGTGEGWITAEYSMLPRATQQRNTRDIAKLKINGRTSEIQRLIGRALRSVTDLSKMGENTMTIDCDVIQADGGTRTASITGGFVAMYLAFSRLVDRGVLAQMPVQSFVAAVSAGIVGQDCVLDLDYEEDSSAVADFNFILNQEGKIIEIQGTGEQRPFDEAEFNEIFALAKKGIAELIDAQRDALEASLKKGGGLL